MSNVTRLPVSRRMRVIAKPTMHQMLQGVVAEIEALPARPTAEQVQFCIDRLEAIRDRLAGEVA